jgi:hypothetical protein
MKISHCSVLFPLNRCFSKISVQQEHFIEKPHCLFLKPNYKLNFHIANLDYRLSVCVVGDICHYFLRMRSKRGLKCLCGVEKQMAHGNINRS